MVSPAWDSRSSVGFGGRWRGEGEEWSVAGWIKPKSEVEGVPDYK